MKAIAFFWSIVASFLLPYPGILFAQENNATGFNEKVVGAWKVASDDIKSCSWEKMVDYYTTHSESVGHLPRTSTEVVQYRFKQDVGSFWLTNSESFNKDKSIRERNTRAEAYVANARYSARLGKAGAEKGWLLLDVSLQTSATGDSAANHRTCPWMDLGNVNAFEWMKEKSFDFLRLESVPGHSRDIVRAHFRYSATQGGATPSSKSGYIDFDTAQGYRPVGYRFNMKTEFVEGFNQGTLEYNDASVLPLVKVNRSEFDTSFPTKGLRSIGKEIHTFTSMQINGFVSDEDFRLSYFDLPEPPGIVWAKPSWSFLWISLIAASFIAFAFLSWKIRNRMTAIQS